jgi:hypothetical protein
LFLLVRTTEIQENVIFAVVLNHFSLVKLRSRTWREKFFFIYKIISWSGAEKYHGGALCMTKTARFLIVTAMTLYSPEPLSSNVINIGTGSTGVILPGPAQAWQKYGTARSPE